MNPHLLFTSNLYLQYNLHNYYTNHGNNDTKPQLTILQKTPHKTTLHHNLLNNYHLSFLTPLSIRDCTIPHHAQYYKGTIQQSYYSIPIPWLIHIVLEMVKIIIKMTSKMVHFSALTILSIAVLFIHWGRGGITLLPLGFYYLSLFSPREVEPITTRLGLFSVAPIYNTQSTSSNYSTQNPLILSTLQFPLVLSRSGLIIYRYTSTFDTTHTKIKIPPHHNTTLQMTFSIPISPQLFIPLIPSYKRIINLSHAIANVG